MSLEELLFFQVKDPKRMYSVKVKDNIFLKDFF